MDQRPHINQILEKFSSKNLQVKIGIELEFYLQNQNIPASSYQVTNFIKGLKSAAINKNIDLLDIEPEQGNGQIEVKTNPYFDLKKLCDDINFIKEISHKIDSDLQVNFSSLPYENDCPSSMQINFSLLENDKFLFAKNQENESQYLLWSVSGLLDTTKDIIEIFAPQKEDWRRFDIKTNRKLHSLKKYTSPVNISWGYDNRSALIRIPATRSASFRRIEYRLGASSCDIELAIAYFLDAVFNGILMQKNPIKEIYGNAFDEQYSYLQRLEDFSN